MAEDITHLRTTPRAAAGTPAVRPADAASLIVIDRSGRQPRVLMGRRHDGHKFMPGFMVFPGGRAEPSDRVMRAYGTLPPHTERNVMARAGRTGAAKARALALCAIRETAEETGILFGAGDCGAPSAPSPAWRPFAEHAVYPSLEALYFVARAITPPWLPRRFDTRFFAADAAGVAHRLEGVVSAESELVEIGWFTFAEASRGHVAEITQVILDEVATRLEQGLERDLPVPFFYERRGRWLRDEI
ncbi:NUDIX hydrolase [Labrys wisconsinensis]|uniref:8-oxo-dGTP pyrophosphatase MutT (NUDIX family) n=1 Tax=Labrys wisconsinensis TaxID=425677 RepID=A0ABU0J353_9HYPH|nr:NUDIX domain-containing protein [Labrys wisconsinensis]MDQ0468693.1 8-oxo-dGTP pyrophosphatase MutT (NUDIX family) [Labrys wisconsinensis]